MQSLKQLSFLAAGNSLSNAQYQSESQTQMNYQQPYMQQQQLQQQYQPPAQNVRIITLFFFVKI